MGTEVLMAAALAGALTSVGETVRSAVSTRKGPEPPTKPVLTADQLARRRGRQSTLTQAGGLSEQPTLGRPSLLGSAAQAI